LLFAGSALAGAADVAAAGAAATICGIATGAATCTAPRCCGVFEIRIFTPLSDESSIESTLD